MRFLEDTKKYDLILKRHNLFSKLPKEYFEKIINYYQTKFNRNNSQSLKKFMLICPTMLICLMNITIMVLIVILLNQNFN